MDVERTLATQSKSPRDQVDDAGELAGIEFEESSESSETEVDSEQVQPGSSNIKSIDEPLTLYLKEIGAFDLLSSAEEIEIAKRKEEGERQVLQAILSTPVAVDHALHLAEQYHAGELALAEVIEDVKGGEVTDESAAALLRQKQQRLFLKKIELVRCKVCDAQQQRRKLCAKRISPQQRRALERDLAVKRGAIVNSLQNLRLAPRQMEVVSDALKKTCACIRSCEQALEAASHGDSKRDDLLLQIRAIEKATGMESAELKARVEAIVEGQKKTNEARRAFVEANLRLVVSIAKRYRRYG
ncbi:MAG: sigma-70 factor domain-containing protein, partial [Candidatus Binatia bacterium]